MRLLQLATGPHQLLDLHPNVTVVTDLEGDSHDVLVDAVAGLARLRAASATGLLEAHGVLFDLDASLLGALDVATPDVDPIVRAGQLPTAPLSVDAQELRRREQEFEEALRQVAARVAVQAEARADVDATAEALAAATVELRRVQQLDDAAPPSERSSATATDDQGLDVGEGDEAVGVDARLEELDQLLVVLAPVDRSPVADALAALGATDADATVPSPEATALADEIDRAEEDLSSLPAAIREVGEGELAQAKVRLDDARQALLEAEHAVRNPELDRVDVLQLEEAHEALIAAIEHADGRFAGGRARQRVVELRAAEQDVLDRLGFNSYSDYMMGYSVALADPAREEALQRARTVVAEVEQEWARLEQAAEVALSRAAVLDRRRGLHERASRLLGEGAIDGSTQEALRALRGPAPAARQAQERLRAALVHAGLDLDEEDLDRDDLSVMAGAWLEEADRLEARREVALEERAALEDRRAELAAAAGNPAEPPAGASPEGSERPDPMTAQAAATAAASRHAAAMARLESEDRAVDALDAKGRAAAAEVERLQDLVAAQGPDGATTAESLEWYLLARLAAQRMVSVAGSTPLLLDDALRDLEPAELEHLLGRLESMAEAVQVIVVSDDPRVASWAESAGPARAAVVRPVVVSQPTAP